MKYDMLSQGTVERIWNTFTGHDNCINKKYGECTGTEERSWSDRDRFVSRLFKKYANKYIVFIDKQTVGYMTVGYQSDTYFYFQEPESVYKPHYGERDYCNHGEPIIRAQKKYLLVDGFRAVNEMYGQGFIEMSCTDVFGDKFAVRLDYNNMRHIQFKEIAKQAFDRVAKLFQDDRSEITFIATRYLTWDEMKKRKIKGSEPVKEDIKVMAKDMKEACKKLTNVIDVRRL